MQRSGTTKILVVSDQPVFLAGLAGVFSTEKDVQVTQELQDPNETLPGIAPDRPDVVVTAFLHCGTDLTAYIKDILYQHADVGVIVVTWMEESDHAERMLRAGAQGIVMADAPIEEFILAVRSIAAGESYLSRRMAALLCAHPQRSDNPGGGLPLQKLTDRELHVFELIGVGLATSAIAGRMGISVKTVETYREHIKRKLSFHDGRELARHAAQWVRTGHSILPGGWPSA